MIEKLVERHSRLLSRFFEILLGLMTWTLLISPVWLGILYPQAIVYLLAFFTIYWSYLASKHTIGIVAGYRKYEKELKVAWLKECKKLNFDKLPAKDTLPKNLKSVRHILLIPAVNEPDEVLKDSLDSIFSQTFPTKQLVLVYTMEEKYSKEIKARLKRIIGSREKELCKFLYYVHPAGIPGEAIGVAGANRTWGAKHAVEDLKRLGENIRDYIFSTIDADHVLHKEYLSRLTHLYLKTEKRDNHFYSTAVHLFDNNLWEVPTVMRIEANAITLGTLSSWGGRSGMKDSFSAYSASLQTLIDADYWDVSLGVDDTIFYWRAFFVRDGNFSGLPHYIPYSADAVKGETYVNSYVSLYKQLLRWGWGAIDFPLTMTEFLKNKKIALSKKIMWTLKHIEKRIILINIVFLITFGFSIVTLVNPQVKQTNFAYSIPRMMSAILTITLIFLIPSTYYRFKLITPMPKEYPLWRKFLVYLESPLIIFNMLTFSFFPFIEAHTRLMLGKRMKDLYHTPKVR